MEQLLPESWVYMHFALILIITCVQMLVIYILGGSSSPPAGLSMYSVYFMAALLGWIAFTLQQGPGSSMAVDITAVVVILNTYILFLAAGARAGITRGRVSIGALCLAACLSGLVLPPQQMFIVQICTTTLFFTLAGLLSLWRSYKFRNIGDGIISFGALVVVASLPFSIYYVAVIDQPVMAQAIAFGSYSSAYVLVTIGFMASVLIEYQDNLLEMATRDPLSQVYNRRGLDEALQLSLASAQRRNIATSAIMVDIDHFHQINTSFGPEIGDQVIRKIGEILKDMSRNSDVVARVDGEKFLLVLPETDLEPARILAERICQAIGSQPLLIAQQSIAVTMSLGVACSQGGTSVDELTAEADNAMRLAKQGGRNQVASIDHEPVHLSANSLRG
ncbi:MAG: GGDEF domain-containing protein [Halioglobus sp.]